MLSNKTKAKLKSSYGDWAVVTGATSGLGLEITKKLAEAGLNLVIIARNQMQLNELAKQLFAEYGVQSIVIAADLSEPKNIQLIINETKSIQVGLLIAAAGFGTSGKFHESNLEEELNMLQTNCSAVIALTHHFANLFVLQKRGGIILFSSLVAFQGTPFSANYAATKAYIQSFAEAITIELKPFNVDLLSVAPGPVASGFGNRANMVMNMAANPDELAVPILNALGKQTNIVPGFLSKFLTYTLRLLPRWGKVKVMATIMGGMTKHQRK